MSLGVRVKTRTRRSKSMAEGRVSFTSQKLSLLGTCSRRKLNFDGAGLGELHEDQSTPCWLQFIQEG